ncbi:Predicted arabinose efflux permease, MFS family [Mesobacillus persicus]|uniref:Predicted arabinose efflux permease, MFS family n=1 Tax=Mesobacillus persicus TaxID=930146 RepID=A0A1H8DBC3_9BACI|nr:MFS transporter [Mesobacillus persicus]SEN04572.1 Predicted arabinose efflux permease, MFS family [Mesobacillus persicus]
METKVSRKTWTQFFALVFGGFVCIEAMVFQAPAVPLIAAHFEVPAFLSGLIILSFYITSTAFYPLAGRVADQIGRKRVILFGMILFTLSEVAAALSPTFSFLLFARVLQGFSVACILPVALAYIGVLFPQEKRGMAAGIFSAVQALASATGAVIAGYLIGIYGWPIVYWISGVLTAIGFFVILALVPESKGEGSKKLDLTGTLLIILTAGSILSVSTLVRSFGIDSPITLGTLGLGVLSAIILWFNQNRKANPLIELSLIKNRLFTMVVIINLVIVAAYQLFIYGMNFFLTTRPGGDVSETGWFYTAIYLSGFFGNLIFGKLTDKFNNGKKLIIGALLIPIITLVIYIFTVNAGTAFNIIFILTFFFGFTMGAVTPVIIKFALGEMPAEKYGAGASLFQFIRDIGAPLGQVTGIVIFTTLTATFTQSALVNEAEQAGVNASLMGAVEQAALTNGSQVDESLAAELETLGVPLEDLLATATASAFTDALKIIALITIAFLVLSIILSVFIPVQRDRKKTKDPKNEFTPPIKPETEAL